VDIILEIFGTHTILILLRKNKLTTYKATMLNR